MLLLVLIFFFVAEEAENACERKEREKKRIQKFKKTS